jgi:hypothetical protein
MDVMIHEKGLFLLPVAIQALVGQGVSKQITAAYLLSTKTLEYEFEEHKRECETLDDGQHKIEVSTARWPRTRRA